MPIEIMIAPTDIETLWFPCRNCGKPTQVQVRIADRIDICIVCAREAVEKLEKVLRKMK